eukprot:749015-Hanusia_phi.AAC.6
MYHPPTGSPSQVLPTISGLLRLRDVHELYTLRPPRPASMVVPQFKIIRKDLLSRTIQAYLNPLNPKPSPRPASDHHHCVTVARSDGPGRIDSVTGAGSRVLRQSLARSRPLVTVQRAPRSSLRRGVG